MDHISPFIFWCQKVMPAVLDDSLSYYEVLCKVTSKLNEVISTTNTTTAGLTKVSQQMSELQNYVDHYFDNLDVQQEINNKLDELVTTGQLQDMVNSLFKDYTDQINSINDAIGNLSSGTPLFASSTDNMTDHTRLYVNTSDGYIYYWNGDTWMNTNQKYQATGIEPGQITEVETSFFNGTGSCFLDKNWVTFPNTLIAISNSKVVVNPNAYSYNTYKINCNQGDEFAWLCVVTASLCYYVFADGENNALSDSILSVASDTGVITAPNNSNYCYVSCAVVNRDNTSRTSNAGNYLINPGMVKLSNANIDTTTHGYRFQYNTDIYEKPYYSAVNNGTETVSAVSGKYNKNSYYLYISPNDIGRTIHVDIGSVTGNKNNIIADCMYYNFVRANSSYLIKTDNFSELNNTTTVPENAVLAVISFYYNYGSPPIVGESATFNNINIYFDTVVKIGVKTDLPVYNVSSYMPKDVYIPVGSEFQIYTRNLINVANIDNYKIYCEGNAGYLYNRYYTVTPTNTTAIPLTFNITNDSNNTIASLSTTLHPYTVPTSSTNKKVLCIGDSIMASGTGAMIQYLSNIISTNMGLNLDVDFIGRLGSGNAKYEATGGYTFASYNANSSTNPFYDGSNVNFKWYVNQYTLADLDYAIIELGWNDAFTEPSTISNNALTMFNNIKTAFPNVKIIYVSPGCPSLNCGYSNTISSRWYNTYTDMDKCFIVNSTMETLCESQSNVYFANTSLILDREYNYPTVELPVNNTNSETVPVQSNNIHPKYAGLKQYSLSAYNILAYLLK